MTAGSSYHLNLNLALLNNDNTIFWFRIIFCKSYWVMENNWFSVWTYHILERSCTWKLCPSVLNCLLLACHDLNMFCSCLGVKAKAHGIDKSWQAHMSSSRKTDSCSQHHPEVLTAQTTPTLTVYETDWYRDSYYRSDFSSYLCILFYSKQRTFHNTIFPPSFKIFFCKLHNMITYIDTEAINSCGSIALSSGSLAY